MKYTINLVLAMCITATLLAQVSMAEGRTYATDTILLGEIEIIGFKVPWAFVDPPYKTPIVSDVLDAEVTDGTFSQTGAVTGTVLNEDKDPVVGAVIEVWQRNKLKGKAISDIDGVYDIKLPRGKYTLVISDSAYFSITKKVPVKNNRTTEVNCMLYSKTKKRHVFVQEYAAPFVLRAYGQSLSSKAMKKHDKEIKRGFRRMAKAKKKSYSYTY